MTKQAQVRQCVLSTRGLIFGTKDNLMQGRRSKTTILSLALLRHSLSFSFTFTSANLAPTTETQANPDSRNLVSTLVEIPIH